jgi:hypothetical protein
MSKFSVNDIQQARAIQKICGLFGIVDIIRANTILYQVPYGRNRYMLYVQLFLGMQWKTIAKMVLQLYDCCLFFVKIWHSVLVIVERLWALKASMYISRPIFFYCQVVIFCFNEKYR